MRLLLATLVALLFVNVALADTDCAFCERAVDWYSANRASQTGLSQEQLCGAIEKIKQENERTGLKKLAHGVANALGIKWGKCLSRAAGLLSVQNKFTQSVTAAPLPCVSKTEGICKRTTCGATQICSTLTTAFGSPFCSKTEKYLLLDGQQVAALDYLGVDDEQDVATTVSASLQKFNRAAQSAQKSNQEAVANLVSQMVQEKEQQVKTLLEARDQAKSETLKKSWKHAQEPELEELMEKAMVATTRVVESSKSKVVDIIHANSYSRLNELWWQHWGAAKGNALKYAENAENMMKEAYQRRTIRWNTVETLHKWNALLATIELETKMWQELPRPMKAAISAIQRWGEHLVSVKGELAKSRALVSWADKIHKKDYLSYNSFFLDSSVQKHVARKFAETTGQLSMIDMLDFEPSSFLNDRYKSRNNADKKKLESSSKDSEAINALALAKDHAEIAQHICDGL